VVLIEPGVLHDAAGEAVSSAPLRGREAARLVGVLLLGVIAYQLNATMVTPALPAIAAALHAPDVAGVSSLFFLSGAIGGILLSRWSDQVGRRRALIVIMLILTGGTLLCLFATSLRMLLLGRVLQGASSAAFQIAYVLLRETMTAEMLGPAIGVVTAISGGVGGLDGYLGGFLVERFGFRAIFVVVLLVGLLALAGVARLLPRDRPDAGTPATDWWGGLLLSGALILAMQIIGSGAGSGWLATPTVLYAIGAGLCFLAFWRFEARHPAPLIAVGILRSRRVWPTVLTTLLTLAGIFAAMNFTIVLMGESRAAGFGLDPEHAALALLTPPALVGVIAAPLAGRLATLFGWTRILRLGMALSIALLLLVACLPERWVAIAAMLLLGVTYNGLVLTPLNGLGVLLSPREAPSALPGLNGAGFAIGASLGIALVAPFVARNSAAGYTTALLVSLAIAALGLLSSLLIPAVATRAGRCAEPALSPVAR